MALRKKILYIFHVSEIGGGSFCLLNIVKYLDKTKYNPIVLLKNVGPLSQELEQLGATVYFEESITTVLYNRSLFRIKSLKQLYKVLTSIPKLQKWFTEIKPDIIHLNSMMLYPYLKPASKLGIKTVIHMRENWPKGEHPIQLMFARKFISKHGMKIIAINSVSADIIGLNFMTDIIHDYISFEGRDKDFDFQNIIGDNYNSLRVFSFFGGLNWQKGALGLVETFVNHVPNKDVRLLLIGSESKQIVFTGSIGCIKKMLTKLNYYRYFDRVKKLSQKDARIIFIPATYQVKSIIEKSFCVISNFSIPHANLTMAEASCLGVPCISAETPEAREYCYDGATLLFEMNNKKGLLNKIELILENHEGFKKKALEGSEIISRIFDPDHNSQLLDDVYNKMLLLG